MALQAATVSLSTSKLYTRAVLPAAIPGSGFGAGLACSSSGTRARISARILRDWGNVDSLWIVRAPHHVVDPPPFPPPQAGEGRVGAGERRWRPPGSSTRRCGGRSRSAACRPPPSRGQALEPLDRLAVALAVGVVHRGEQVGRPRQLELNDGQGEAGMALEDAGEDQIAQRQCRIDAFVGRVRCPKICPRLGLS